MQCLSLFDKVIVSTVPRAEYCGCHMVSTTNVYMIDQIYCCTVAMTFCLSLMCVLTECTAPLQSDVCVN